ncbi:SPOR domain-containing protein [Cognatishimia sp. MH4019]|uniref:SPOR domain-containing protein n=1 Tax=Cognatishimia sp. MH4019 TaxID=2854030 RepID=UPI001CD32F77|nr:SPOR domain-containing protein [Cognatishimia sp. MH4019]
MTAGGAAAQGDIPAEFPPASFTAKQYVDSRGCVYVRAGISGNTTWVPRVTRSRKQICGMQPSLGSRARVAEAPAAAPAAPEIIEPRQTAQATPRRPAAPRIFQRQPGRPIDTVASARPAPKAVVRTQQAPRSVVRAPAAQPRVVVRRPVAAAPAPQATRRQAACQGASALSSRYINSGGKAAVRCGPQAESPVTVLRGSNGQRVVATAPARREVITPPPGYRRVWEDDRLNPNRGPRTAQGDAQMARVWTDTLPREGKTRVRSASSGCQGASALSSRYINSGEKAAVRCGPQAEAPVTYVTRQAAPTKRIKAPKKQTRVVRKERLSAMNAPAPRQQARAASHRFVQVGTFGVPQNATNTARRLQASGLPVRLSKYSKGGKNYTIVLAGPFGTQSQLNAGLNRARQAGFRDAFLRK